MITPQGCCRGALKCWSALADVFAGFGFLSLGAAAAAAVPEMKT